MERIEYLIWKTKMRKKEMVCEVMIKTLYCEIKESDSCKNTAKRHDDFKAPTES